MWFKSGNFICPTFFSGFDILAHDNCKENMTEQQHFHLEVHPIFNFPKCENRGDSDLMLKITFAFSFGLVKITVWEGWLVNFENMRFWVWFREAINSLNGSPMLLPISVSRWVEILKRITFLICYLASLALAKHQKFYATKMKG